MTTLWKLACGQSITHNLASNNKWLLNTIIPTTTENSHFFVKYLFILKKMKIGDFKSNFLEFRQLMNKNAKYTQLHYVFVIVTQWLGHEFDPQQFWQMSIGFFLFSFFSWLYLMQIILCQTLVVGTVYRLVDLRHKRWL
jgi:hypothetical protein